MARELCPPASPFIPKYIFLTKGVGRHKEQLQSFEMALRDAGIAEFNIVSVSSIFPPNCRVITRQKGLAMMQPGQMTFAVLTRTATNEAHRLVASSVGLAIPRDPNQYGYLSEHHSYGEKEEQAGEYAEDLAASMLATILGVEFDPDKHYNEKKEIWKISGKFIRTQNVTQTALGDKNNLWTTVIAAAVFL